MFDKDNNGYITLDELQRAMQMIGENVTDAQLKEMLTIADLDKDGKINYEGEFETLSDRRRGNFHYSIPSCHFRVCKAACVKGEDISD